MKPRVLIVDDEPDLLESLKTVLLQQGVFDIYVEANPRAALRRVGEEPWDLVLLDLNMPDVHGLDILEELVRNQSLAECIVLTAVHDPSMAVQALKLGAFDYLTKPVDVAKLTRTVRRVMHLDSAIEAIDARDAFLARFEHPEVFRDIITVSPKMAQIFRYLERVAPTDESVVVSGPSGSGKELIARAIHQLSPRRDGPFVGVNIAAIPASLFASELFGHAPGAFSGAQGRRRGYFGEAAAGTLFLDEIGELDPALQVQLLRVLQEREYFAVGESKPTQLEARVVVASNRDLEEETGSGRFRADLFYRLNATAVQVPPLARRPEDIPFLVEHFAKVMASQYGKPIRSVHPRLIKLLCQYPFPGNVRELENVIRQAVLAEDNCELRPGSLPEAYRRKIGRDRSLTHGRGDIVTLAEFEREHIERVLQSTGGNVTQAAKALGISRATLQRRLRSYRASGSSL